MTKLLLMRHAKSAWDDESLSDFDRPLNDRGRTAAPLMADYLAEHNLVPNLIVSSNSNRTRQTASLMLSRWTKPITCIWLETLYLAPPRTIAQAVAEHWCEGNILVLGHNPGMEIFCESLARTSLPMPTAAICGLEWNSQTPPSTVADITANHFSLLFHVVPKSLQHE